jgi:hypothetical protein
VSHYETSLAPLKVQQKDNRWRFGQTISLSILLAGVIMFFTQVLYSAYLPELVAVKSNYSTKAQLGIVRVCFFPYLLPGLMVRGLSHQLSVLYCTLRYTHGLTYIGNISCIPAWYVVSWTAPLEAAAATCKSWIGRSEWFCLV